MQPLKASLIPRSFRQFGLRTLLLVCFLSAVCFGVVRWHMDVVHRQDLAVEKLAEKDGFTQGRVWGPKWLRGWLGNHYFTKIVMVDLQYSGKFTDDDLKVLVDLPTVERLYLADNPKITDAGLDHLRGLTEVRRLALWNTGITDAGLAKLDHMQKLEALDVNTTKVTLPGLARFAKLKHLETLIHGFVVDDEGIEVLSRFPNLVIEHLETERLNETSFASLRDRLNFKALTVREPAAENWSEFLQHHPTLRSLGIERATISDDALRDLVNANDLVELFVNEVPVSNAILPDVAAIKNLRTFTVYKTQIDAREFLRHFGQFGAEVKVEDDSIEVDVYVCWSVRFGGSGFLYSGQVNGGDLVALASATNAQQLVIGQDIPGEKDWSGISHMKQLDFAQFLCPITDDLLDDLVSLPKLKRIDVWGQSQEFTANGIKALKESDSLRCLTLRWVGLSDDCLVGIGECHELEELLIFSNPLTSQGIKHLMGLQKLKWLDISSCNLIDNEALIYIAQLKTLERLNLEDTAINNHGLEALYGMANLNRIECGNTTCTTEGLLKLLKTLPARMPPTGNDPFASPFP